MPRPDSQFQGALARLRSDLRRGRPAAGALLPGEHALAARLGVGRSTLRTVLKALLAEGLVRNRPGLGWEVAAPVGALAGPLVVVLSRLVGPELELIEPIQRRAAERGWNVHLRFVQGLEAPALRPDERPGAVCYLGGRRIPVAHLQAATALEVPVVAAGLADSSPHDSVGVDNPACVRRLCDHLATLPGVQPVHLGCAGQEADPSFVQRQQAFIAAQQAMQRAPLVRLLPHGGMDAEDADRLFASFPPRRGTCFVCGSHDLLRDLLRHAVRRGLAVPAEYGIVGYHGAIDRIDCELLGISRPTAFSFPAEAIADAALGLVAQRLAQPTRDPVFRAVPAAFLAPDSITPG